MRAIIYVISLSIFSFTLANSSAFALDDRVKQADRYMNAVPIQDLVNDMVENMSARMPEQQRKAFRSSMLEHLDIELISRVTKDSLIKHFTAEELKALADFYGSDVGKSVTKKFGIYMAEVMPVIQQESMKAGEKAYEQLQQSSQ